MKQKYINMYMDWASRCAELSHARRLHVGAVIVKDDTVISYGYNGMPAGWDNNCEYEIIVEDGDDYATELKTRPEVLHAESNAIAKLARSINSGHGADIFITHAPCLDCAKLIYQSGINSVYYRTAYRDSAGVDFLTKSSVTVTQIE
jgi:dCMP deaminase